MAAQAETTVACLGFAGEVDRDFRREIPAAEFELVRDSEADDELVRSVSHELHAGGGGKLEPFPWVPIQRDDQDGVSCVIGADGFEEDAVSPVLRFSILLPSRWEWRGRRILDGMKRGRLARDRNQATSAPPSRSRPPVPTFYDTP